MPAHRQTFCRLAAFCLTVLFLFALGCSASREEPTFEPPTSATRKSPSQPDDAHRYFLQKRLPKGTAQVDLVARYAAADRHMETLPRFASRQGLYLPSTREMAARPELATKAVLETWEQLGPGNIGGRTRALVIDPDRPDIMYAAGVSGGVWKTLNGGRSWRPLADLMPNIVVGSLVLDPVDTRVLYAGTGEGVFRSNAFRGAGIFKSVNSGKTWKRLDSTWNADFRYVNKLVISPNDRRRVYAATRTGVFRSRNGGNTWRQILTTTVMNGCMDLAIRTDRPTDVLFASCGSFEQATVYRHPAAEAGGPWTAVLSEPDMGRTSLAIAPSNQDIIYALAASLGETPESEAYEHGLHAVFRSDLGGEEGTWTATVRNDDPQKLNTVLLSRPSSAFFADCFNPDIENDLTGQGWWDNTIAVDPTNPEVVFVGGVDLMRSDDGGRNWGIMSYWWFSPPSAHADHHTLVFHPRYNGRTNRTLFVGNDGGVWKTENARAGLALGPEAACSPLNTRVEWTALNSSYGVTQFYHGQPFPDAQSYVGGTQDNGTILGRDTSGINGWREIRGGDGGYVAIDPRRPRTLYVETQRLNLLKSTDGGETFRSVIVGIDEDPDNFLFIVPYTMDPRRSNRLWLGGRTVWRTTNGANLWRPASPQLSDLARISALAVAPGNPNRVLVGLSDGRIHRTDEALRADSKTEWPFAQPRRDAFISWIAFDPANDDIVYATSSTLDGKHIFRSLDGGVSFQQIDGNGPRRLPNIPVHAIVADPEDPERLYVGTDRGVFVSTSGGLRWAVENTGFSNVIVQALSIVEHQDGRRFLFAFTHGRGAWRVEIDA